MDPAEKYREELHEEVYFEHYENGDTDYLSLLVEEFKRVKERKL